MNDLKLIKTYDWFESETYENLWMIRNLWKMNFLKLTKAYEWLETYENLWIFWNLQKLMND